MDIDDDDAFLYGDEPEQQPQSIAQAQAQAHAQAEAAKESAISASMAASLAAYGIDASAAVVEALPENPEDGGVEEEDEGDEDEDEESDEDDVKLVFTGGSSRQLDLRKPQQAPAVVGIGKWAHASTGAQAPATPSTPQAGQVTGTPTKSNQNDPGQTTEYTPAPRPSASATPQPQSVNALANPPIAPTSQAPNLQPQPSSITSVVTADANGPPTNPNLPPSHLPPVTNPSANPRFDPSNPSGLIPSSGQSVYDIDLSLFEGSGQPWRQPGAVVSDWFNFGFDEHTFPKWVRYRTEMGENVKSLAAGGGLGAGAGVGGDTMNQMGMNGMNGMTPQAQAQAQAQAAAAAAATSPTTRPPATLLQTTPTPTRTPSQTQALEEDKK